uniref:Cation channel sperm associated 3 n=1 Tax=Nothoprocta perdicaria TaxID=30464 RepID=A0A8C6YN76_NOTPE
MIYQDVTGRVSAPGNALVAWGEMLLLGRFSARVASGSPSLPVATWVSQALGGRRKDAKFCAYLRRLLGSPVFAFLMICVVSLNAILLAIETDYRLRLNSSTFFAVRPGNAFQGLQALRILKLIKYSSGMRALGQMVKTVMYVLILLFMLMFIFAILGHGLYGDPETGDTENWGNMEAAFFTLFSLVTVDGWTDLQQELEDHGFVNSHVFTTVFILLGFFVFFHMFIGVVIIKMQESNQKYERERKAKRKAAIWAKKQALLKKQQEEMTFNEMVDNFKKTLHHTDSIIVEDFCVSLRFIDLYLTVLDLQDESVERLVTVELVSMEETPRPKTPKLSFDVLGYFLE